MSSLMTGGFLVAAGNSGKAEASYESSSQYAVLLNLSSTQPVGTQIHIQTSDGEEILAFAPTKVYESIAFSSTALASGSTYEV